MTLLRIATIMRMRLGQVGRLIKIHQYVLRIDSPNLLLAKVSAMRYNHSETTPTWTLCVMVPFQVAQHRDIIQNEYARANLAKSKLENLCRELQKHSKQVAVSRRDGVVGVV